MSNRAGFHQTGSVVLECKHVVILPVPLPVRGDLQYCRTCADYLPVQDSHDSYVVKCNTGKCRLNKNMRADKAGAMALARKHVQKYSRHKVTVFDGMISVAEVTNTDETLFVTAEERSVIAAESQKLLRNLGVGSTAGTDSMG